jgi:hypothetical protein
MGKTSQESRLNIPGKIAWIAMELPGPLIMSYTMYTLPAELGLKSLPWENWALGGIFVRSHISSSCTVLVTLHCHILPLSHSNLLVISSNPCHHRVAAAHR